MILIPIYIGIVGLQRLPILLQNIVLLVHDFDKHIYMYSNVYMP